jgi:hypothetical protein
VYWCVDDVLMMCVGELMCVDDVYWYIGVLMMCIGVLMMYIDVYYDVRYDMYIDSGVY